MTEAADRRERRKKAREKKGMEETLNSLEEIHDVQEEGKDAD